MQDYFVLCTSRGLENKSISDQWEHLQYNWIASTNWHFCFHITSPIVKTHFSHFRIRKPKWVLRISAGSTNLDIADLAIFVSENTKTLFAKISTVIFLNALQDILEYASSS